MQKIDLTISRGSCAQDEFGSRENGGVKARVVVALSIKTISITSLRLWPLITLAETVNSAASFSFDPQATGILDSLLYAYFNVLVFRSRNVYIYIMYIIPS